MTALGVARRARRGCNARWRPSRQVPVVVEIRRHRGCAQQSLDEQERSTRSCGLPHVGQRPPPAPRLGRESGTAVPRRRRDVRRMAAGRNWAALAMSISTGSGYRGTSARSAGSAPAAGETEPLLTAEVGSSATIRATLASAGASLSGNGGCARPIAPGCRWDRPGSSAWNVPTGPPDPHCSFSDCP